MTATKADETRREADEACAQLRELLPPGSTVKTILRHVSRSGMTRAISPVVNGEDVTYLVVRAVPSFKFNRTHGGITMSGCGMDMGFSLVHTLSRTLYPDGFECIGYPGFAYSAEMCPGRPCGEGCDHKMPDDNPRCPSNDHSNGDRDYTPHHHVSGEYALRQAWL